MSLVGRDLLNAMSTRQVSTDSSMRCSIRLSECLFRAMRALAMYASLTDLQGLSETEIERALEGKHLFLLTDYRNHVSTRKRLPVKSARMALTIENPKLLRTCQLVLDGSDVAFLKHAGTGKLIKSAILMD